MTIAKESGRQYPLVAVCTFTGGTEVTTAGTYEAIDLPAGAIITGGSFYTPGGFTNAGEVAIHVGSYVLFVAEDINAEKNIALDLTTDDELGAALTANDTVDVVLTVAPLIDGTGRIIVKYVIADRANEVQPV